MDPTTSGPSAPDGASADTGERDVHAWQSFRRRQRLRRTLVTAVVILIGSTIVVALGTSGSPASGLEAATIPSPNPDARLVWHPSYGMPWFDNAHRLVVRLLVGDHAVPIVRFPALTRRLVDDGVVTAADVTLAPIPGRDELSRVHTAEYLAKLDRLTEGWILQEGLTRPGENRISSDLYTFIQASVGGTDAAAEIALEHGLAMNLSGGYHHAYPGHEEGFCFLNDVAISIERLLAQGRIDRAMIVDLDTHHGNGNASVFRTRPEVAIFDMFERENYPRDKVPIEYAVPLAEGTDDEDYLEDLEALFGAVAEQRPGLLFYIAGADPFAGDVLGNQRLTMDGLRRRDEYVLAVCEALEVPVVVVLGGGYSTAEELAEINGNTALALLGRGDGASREEMRDRVGQQKAEAEAETEAETETETEAETGVESKAAQSDRPTPTRK